MIGYDIRYQVCEHANLINEMKRHCRIANVRQKSRYERDKADWIKAERNLWLRELPGQYTVPKLDFDPLKRFTFPVDARKCSCPPGTACGNAACPHLPIVTCNSNMMSVQ